MAELTHHRVKLAAEQLECSLSLFLRKQSYVSALTLAGAAEEILGQALKGCQQQTFLGFKYESVSPFHAVMHGKQLAWSEFVEVENRARNASKHMRSSTEETITCDLEDEALWMIVRACYNSDRLGLPRTQQMDEFENWFFENVVGY